MKVKDVLTAKPAGVISIAPESSLLEASKLLTEHNIGVLVVVDAETHPIGILSERDIIRAAAQHGTQAFEHTVSSTMTAKIITATQNDNLASLSNTMTTKRIRHVPIVDDQTLVGIVSIGDIVKAQLSYFEGEARALEQYIIGGHA